MVTRNKIKPPKHPEWTAEAETVVQFNDLDPMNVVWHGNYPKFLELARFALLNKIGYNYEQMKASDYAWPIIDMHIRYSNAAVFSQRLKIRAEIVEWEYRLVMEYIITDAVTGKRISHATTTQVAVDMTNNEMCFASPDILLGKLGLK